PTLVKSGAFHYILTKHNEMLHCDTSQQLRYQTVEGCDQLVINSVCCFNHNPRGGGRTHRCLANAGYKPRATKEPVGFMASLDGIASVDVIVRDRNTGELEERPSDVSIGSVARRPTFNEMILSA